MPYTATGLGTDCVSNTRLEGTWSWVILGRNSYVKDANFTLVRNQVMLNSDDKTLGPKLSACLRVPLILITQILQVYQGGVKY